MIEWEEIRVGVAYADLASGHQLTVTKVTKTRVTIEGRLDTMSIWEFRLRVMPSGRTTASED